MAEVLIITPVKNSIENTLETAGAINASDIPHQHYIYNDFSTDETTEKLEANKNILHYQLVNLADITDTPSPNYKLVLQQAQKNAIQQNLPLIIVESDVVVKPDTFSQMLTFSKQAVNTGMVGAITVDNNGVVNFPYLKFKGEKKDVINTKKSLSFCCTLLSVDFLKSYDFTLLNNAKDWFDIFISAKSIENGFNNYVLMNVPVLHKPHGSRPWKQLKYTNPLKYYFLKFTKRRDKI